VALRTFLRALIEERWTDAAALLYLADLDQHRRQVAAAARRSSGPVEVTVEDLLRSEPQMPRVVAEYQLKRIRANTANGGGFLSHEFAGVTDPLVLDSLPLQEVATRWLQAQDPAMRMLDDLRGNGCPMSAGLDSALRSVSITILGSVVGDDSALVLFRNPWFPQADSGYYGSGPQVARLVRGDSAGWRLLPRHDLLHPDNVMAGVKGCPKRAGGPG